MYHLGESMKSLLQTSVFSSLEEELSNVASMISSAKVVQLMAPADIEGVLALAQLESALLDNSQHYRRRVLLQEGTLAETISQIYQKSMD